MADIAKFVDKSWEDKSFTDIANAPVSALQGVSEADAAALQQALGITSVADLANNKFVRWAQAIVALSG
jgi:hypothetical protein